MLHSVLTCIQNEQVNARFICQNGIATFLDALQRCKVQDLARYFSSAFNIAVICVTLLRPNSIRNNLLPQFHLNPFHGIIRLILVLAQHEYSGTALGQIFCGFKSEPSVASSYDGSLTIQTAV